MRPNEATNQQLRAGLQELGRGSISSNRQHCTAAATIHGSQDFAQLGGQSAAVASEAQNWPPKAECGWCVAAAAAATVPPPTGPAAAELHTWPQQPFVQ